MNIFDAQGTLRELYKQFIIFFFFFQTSMEEIGCVTPFGPSKNDICNETEKAKEAILYYKNGIFSLNYGKCYEACTHLTTRLSVESGNENIDSGKLEIGKLEIKFNPKVLTIESYFIYTGGSLIAEFGGYVGLFLGFSVYQLTEFFDYIMNIKVSK